MYIANGCDCNIKVQIFENDSWTEVEDYPLTKYSLNQRQFLETLKIFKNYWKLNLYFRYTQIGSLGCISLEARIICFGGHGSNVGDSDWETIDVIAEYASAQRCKISFILIIDPFLHHFFLPFLMFFKYKCLKKFLNNQLIFFR